MPHSGHFDSRTAFADLRILYNVKPMGPIIGVFAGVPFHEYIRDDWGREYGFAGIAHRARNSDYGCEHLGTGEFVLPPGIIYRMVGIDEAKDDESVLRRMSRAILG